METISTQPQLSIVERNKKEAGEYVAHKIEQLMSDEGVSSLAAARSVYEMVKGNDYRQEQAAAKLLELLNLQNEIDTRSKEIQDNYGSMSKFTMKGTSNNMAANDEKYLVAA